MVTPHAPHTGSTAGLSRTDDWVPFDQPPIAHLSTSFYEQKASDERNVLAHLRSLEGLGFVLWFEPERVAMPRLTME